MENTTIALPKGRMLAGALELLMRAGLDCSAVTEKSRSLVFYDKENGIRFLTVRPSDVPVYVEHGAADLGITGKDVLLEGKKDVYELLDLGFGRCRFVLAAPQEKKERSFTEYISGLRVATKFPRITEEYLKKKGIHGEVIRLNGAVELAPAVGLSEMIVDIVSTGRTLKENNLQVVEDILQSTARLIANRASYRMKAGRMAKLVDAVEKAVAEGGYDSETVDSKRVYS